MAPARLEVTSACWTGRERVGRECAVEVALQQVLEARAQVQARVQEVISPTIRW